MPESKNKQSLVLDSSQISTFLDCPQQWDYCYNESLVTIGEAVSTKSSAMAMGTLIHKYLEIYYKERANGNYSAAADVALAFDPDDQDCKCGHLKVNHVLMHSINIAETCVSPDMLTETDTNECRDCDCQDYRPEPFPVTPEDRELVRKRFLEYTWTYAKNDFQPINAESVELGFSYRLYEDDNYLFVLEGRIDGLGTLGQHQLWWDHKSQSRRRDLYPQSIQFRNYALTTKKLYGIINYIRMTKKVDDSTYKRQIVSFPSDYLEWWERELIGLYFKVLEQLGLQQRTGKIEQNWGACSGKYGYPCNYTTLCEERNSHVRDNLKKQFYTERPKWHPW